MSNALENLPPEMQARIAQIMAGNTPDQSPHQAAIQQPAPEPAPPVPPVVKQPSLMDHVIALRQEVAALRNQIDANSNVVDAVGQAVGTMYQMFQPSPQAVDQGTTFGSNFQQQQNLETPDF